MNVRRVLVCLALLLASGFALADEPVLTSVQPAFGFTDEETEITIRGEGFEARAHAALFGGGGVVEVGGLRWPDWDFYPRAVAVVNDLAHLVSTQGTLKIVDVANPSAPEEIGHVDLPGPAQAIAIDGGFAYVLEEAVGLQVIDVTLPTAPRVVAGLEIDDPPVAMATSDGLVLTVGVGTGLQVIDVADPRHPKLLTTLEVPTTPQAIHVAGHRAYIAGGRSGDPDDVGWMAVVDLQIPASPVVVGEVTFPGRARDVRIDGDLAYLVGDDLRVVDVRDPANPMTISHSGLFGPASRIDVAGSHAFAARPGGTFQVFDVVDPTTPRPVGGTGLTPDISDLAIAGGYAHVTDLWRGLIILDIREPAVQGIVGGLELPGQTRDFAVADDLAFVTLWAGSDEQGMPVIDLSDRERPLLIGMAPTAGSPAGVAAANGLAYVTTSRPQGSALEIVNLSDPAAPIVIGTALTRGRGHKVALDDRYAYVVGRVDVPVPGGGQQPRAFLQIVDVGDPSRPLEVSWTTPLGARTGYARAVLAVDGFVFIGISGYGDGEWLVSVDVRDPNRPVTRELVEMSSAPRGLAASGSLLYAAAEDLYVVDIANPDAPSIVAQRWLGRPAWDVALGEQLAHVAGDGIIHVVDVRDPAVPVVIDRFGTAGVTRDIIHANDHVYATADYWLTALRVNPPLEQVRVEGDDTLVATVPRRFVRGPYHPRVSQGNEAAAELFRGYRVCERRAIGVSLIPLDIPTPPRLALAPFVWRAEITGDDRLFVPTPLHRAALDLPDLPDLPEPIYVPAMSPDVNAIELHLAPTLGRGVVKLIGADEAALRMRWREIVEAGGLDLPVVDDHHYGDIELSVGRRTSSASPIADPQSGQVGFAPVVHRYEFTDGVLTAARAWGQDVDHVFTAKATYDRTCEVEGTASYVETLTTLCERFQAEHPELVMDCEN